MKPLKTALNRKRYWILFTFILTTLYVSFIKQPSTITGFIGYLFGLFSLVILAAIVLLYMRIEIAFFYEERLSPLFVLIEKKGVAFYQHVKKRPAVYIVLLLIITYLWI